MKTNHSLTWIEMHTADSDSDSDSDECPIILTLCDRNRSFQKSEENLQNTFVGHQLGEEFDDIKIYFKTAVNYKKIEEMLKNSKQYQYKYKSLCEQKFQNYENIDVDFDEGGKNKLKVEIADLNLKLENQNKEIEALHNENKELRKIIERLENEKNDENYESQAKKRRIE